MLRRNIEITVAAVYAVVRHFIESIVLLAEAVPNLVRYDAVVCFVGEPGFYEDNAIVRLALPDGAAPHRLRSGAAELARVVFLDYRNLRRLVAHPCGILLPVNGGAAAKYEHRERSELRASAKYTHDSSCFGALRWRSAFL
jgi:hypothetical protein